MNREWIPYLMSFKWKVSIFKDFEFTQCMYSAIFQVTNHIYLVSINVIWQVQDMISHILIVYFVNIDAIIVFKISDVEVYEGVDLIMSQYGLFNIWQVLYSFYYIIL